MSNVNPESTPELLCTQLLFWIGGLKGNKQNLFKQSLSYHFSGVFREWKVQNGISCISLRVVVF